MKMYANSTLFPSNKKEKTQLIPKTEFMSGTNETIFHSEKNTAINPFTNSTSMTLSYKIGYGISDSQLNDYNIYRGSMNGKEFYLACLPAGSKNQYEYFYMDFKNSEFVSTNMYTHHLFKLMIAYERFNTPKGELDKMFRMINFNTDEGIIGADQKKQFYICADSLYFLSKELFLNKQFDDDATEADFEEYAKHITDDITGFALNDYDGALSNAAKQIGITATKHKKFNLLMPEVQEKPLTPEEKMKKIKEKYINGVKTFTQKQIKAMPPLLRNGYELAIASFEANKNFFGLEEWQLVDAIASGDVHSINFTGPAGVGKTTTIRSIAGALGMPFVLVGGSANIEETDLLGTRNVEAQDGVSVTTWTDGPITMAIRYGAFLLFDEVNAADPGILMKLNTILDGSKSLILSTAEEVKVHPNFVYSEAMNVGSAYSGTDQMNQSHFDRMDEMFKISSKTPKEEAKIISSNTGYENLENLEKMCLIKKEILKLIETEGDASQQICSPRRMISWAKKAKRTGEFIESSLSTVIAHLTVYDDSFDRLSREAVLESSGIAATVLEKIIEQFDGVTY